MVIKRLRCFNGNSPKKGIQMVAMVVLAKSHENDVSPFTSRCFCEVALSAYFFDEAIGSWG
jgi:hypothetical protein